MSIDPNCYRGAAERELSRWGIELTERNISPENERIMERLGSRRSDADQPLVDS